MEPITEKTVRVTTGSGIFLVVVALVVMTGLLYAFISVTQLDWKNWINLMFTSLFGISVYYLAFSIMSGLLIRKKSPAVPPAK